MTFWLGSFLGGRPDRAVEDKNRPILGPTPIAFFFALRTKYFGSHSRGSIYLRQLFGISLARSDKDVIVTVNCFHITRPGESVTSWRLKICGDTSVCKRHPDTGRENGYNAGLFAFRVYCKNSQDIETVFSASLRLFTCNFADALAIRAPTGLNTEVSPPGKPQGKQCSPYNYNC